MNLFRDVEVVHRLFGNTRVQWRWADGKFLESLRPVELSLEWAHTALGDWRRAENAVLFDSGMALDPDRRLFGEDVNLFYRIRADSSGKSYFSEPTRIGDTRTDNMAKNVREALRILELNFRKNYHALDGCLFKRRIWGKRCPECVDPATGEVSKLECPACLQTGVIRGYYPPYPLKVLATSRKTRFNYVKPETASFIDHGLVGAAISFPVPVDERDVWMNHATGEMFRIGDRGQPVEDSMRLGNLVVQQRFTMDIVPAGHILYRLPAYCDGGAYSALYAKVCEPYEKPKPECALPVGVESSQACPDLDFAAPEEPVRVSREQESLVWPE